MHGKKGIECGWSLSRISLQTENSLYFFNFQIGPLFSNKKSDIFKGEKSVAMESSLKYTKRVEKGSNYSKQSQPMPKIVWVFLSR